jgi:hypothetical protein
MAGEDEKQLFDRAVRYTAAALIAADDARCRFLADTAWRAMTDLAQLHGGTSGTFLRRDVFEAVHGEVMAAVTDRILAITPQLAAALAGITDERAMISAYSDVLAEDLAIRQ